MAVFFQKREIVVPGQLLAEGRYRAAVGAYGEDDKVFAAVVGLAELRGNTVKVVPLQGVYIPREGDLVIGKITIVAGNNWKVELGSGPYLASLHANNALRRPYDDDISRYMDIGDVIVAEPGALIGFAGPRVIKETTQQELPEGFQRAEFLSKHGLIDCVVPRKDLKDTLIAMLDFMDVSASAPA